MTSHWLFRYPVMDPNSPLSNSRRPWWATFSVRAHRDLRALAADMLLYDRLILPRPADAAQHARFVQAGWDPELQEAVERQAADSVYSVLWSASLRKEWKAQWRTMTAAGKPDDAAFGETSLVMAQTERGRDEIAAALAPGTPPDQRPILMPAFQSTEEAQAELSLREPATDADIGQTPADRALTVEMSRLVEEPALTDPRRPSSLLRTSQRSPAFRRREGICSHTSIEWRAR